jgi:two-component system, cell cycle response regulator DivK
MGRILVAEDNPANLELMREILDIQGHEIIEAHDGSEALLQAEMAKPDLILLDVNMPVLNGFEVLERLRANPQLAPIKVIALTAYAMRGDREKALEAGFDGYLTKPIDIQTLTEMITAFLDHNNRHGKRYGT